MAELRRGLGAALLVLVATAGARAGDEPTREGARRLLAEGRAAEAVEAFRALRERAAEREAPPGERADLEADLAGALAAVGELDEALAHYEEALRGRERAEDRIAYAETLLAVARRNLAAPNPSSRSVLPYLGDAIQAAERVNEPAFASRRACVTAEALAWLGEAEKAVKRWGEVDWAALPEAQARAQREHLALALHRLGRFGEAAEAWRAAGNRRGEASAWAAARDAARAIPLYAALLAESPQDAALLDDALAAARYANGRKALADALAALRVEGPARAGLAEARAALAEETGDLAGATALYREAAAAEPGAVAPWIGLGRVLLAAAGPAPNEAARDAMVEAWLEGLRRAPEDTRIRRLVWEQAGIDYAEGARAGGSPAALARSLRAQRALAETGPEDAEAWANLGNSLRVAGDAAGSLEAYGRARAADPESASIRSDQGLALAGAGDLAGALEAFEDAVRLDPAFVSALQNAARFRWAAGDDAAAEAHLGAALRAARAQGRGEMLFRFLLDRTWRTRRRPESR